MRGDRQELQPGRSAVHAAGRTIAVVCGDCVRGGGSLGSVLAAVSNGAMFVIAPPFERMPS